MTLDYKKESRYSQWMYSILLRTTGEPTTLPKYKIRDIF